MFTVGCAWISCSQEFEAWLKEVKKIVDFNGPKWQLMDYFGQYCEEYNTVTLPSEKYEILVFVLVVFGDCLLRL